MDLLHCKCGVCTECGEEWERERKRDTAGKTKQTNNHVEIFYDILLQ